LKIKGDGGRRSIKCVIIALAPLPPIGIGWQMTDSPDVTALDAALRQIIADNPDASKEEHRKIFRDMVDRDPALKDALTGAAAELLYEEAFDLAFPWVGEKTRPN
jgi:hypothetical protein